MENAGWVDAPPTNLSLEHPLAFLPLQLAWIPATQVEILALANRSGRRREDPIPQQASPTSIITDGKQVPQWSGS